jgi:hypothetical protein
MNIAPLTDFVFLNAGKVTKYKQFVEIHYELTA